MLKKKKEQEALFQLLIESIAPVKKYLNMLSSYLHQYKLLAIKIHHIHLKSWSLESATKKLKGANAFYSTSTL